MYRKRILVVEDETSIADIIVFALNKESLDCDRVATLSEARAIYEKNTFDLILLDVSLPDGTGFDFCEEIKKNDNIPIVFLTARDEETSLVRGLTLGEDYVTKPFSPTALVLKIKNALEKVKGEEVSRSESGFHVDNDKNLITFKGQILKLGLLEYEILKLLVKRPGRVFSRNDIIELCWPDEPNMDSDRTVDTHIKTIRKKIGDIEPTEDIIITHYKRGYSLKD